MGVQSHIALEDLKQQFSMRLRLQRASSGDSVTSTDKETKWLN